MSETGVVDIKDVNETFQHRIKSPVFGSILLAFIGVNWKALFYLIFSTNISIADRIKHFESQTDIWSLLAYPVAIGTAITLIMPFVNYAAAWAVSWPTTQRRLLGIKSASDSLSAREALAEQRAKTLAAIEAQDIERLKRDKTKRKETENQEIADFKSRSAQRQTDEEREIAAFAARAEDRRKNEEQEETAHASRAEQRKKDEEAEIAAFAARAASRRQTEEHEIEAFNARAAQRADSEKEKPPAGQTKQRTLEPIPELSESEVNQAEKAALELLQAGKVIPKEIALKVRKIGSLESPFPVKEIALLKYCQFLTEAYLNRSSATDFHQLAKFQYLQRLSLWGTSIANVEPLKNLLSLRMLDLDRTSIKSITPLKDLHNITFLSVSHTSIRSLVACYKMSKMRYLFINRTNVTNLSPLRNIMTLTYVSAIGLNISDWSSVEHVEEVKKY